MAYLRFCILWAGFSGLGAAHGGASFAGCKSVGEIIGAFAGIGLAGLMVAALVYCIPPVRRWVHGSRRVENQG